MFAMRPVWKEAGLMVERPDLIDDAYFTAPEHFNNNAEARAEKARTAEVRARRAWERAKNDLEAATHNLDEARRSH